MCRVVTDTVTESLIASHLNCENQAWQGTDLLLLYLFISITFRINGDETLR